MEPRKLLIFRTAFVTFCLTFIFGFLLLYGGCRGISKYIVSHRNCERFNIDNYEIRTQTDIPNTDGVTCHYDSATHTKSSVFQLDVSEEKLISNIGYNDMYHYTECTITPFLHNPDWNDSISKLPKEHLYYKKGHYKNDSWIFVLDSVNQTLWAELTAKE